MMNFNKYDTVLKSSAKMNKRIAGKPLIKQRENA